MTPLRPGSLYYITHINNVPSLLENGILSHNEVVKRNIVKNPIYAPDIVERRQGIVAPNGDSLWDYANLYFQPRNPMLYIVINAIDRECRINCVNGLSY